MAAMNGSGQAHARRQQTAASPSTVGRGDAVPWLANEIAQLSADAITTWRKVDDGALSVDEIYRQTRAQVALLERIGWISDTISAATGGFTMLGADPEAWMLPEPARQALGPGKLKARANQEAGEVGEQEASLGPSALVTDADEAARRMGLLFERIRELFRLAMDGGNIDILGTIGFETAEAGVAAASRLELAAKGVRS